MTDPAWMRLAAGAAAAIAAAGAAHTVLNVRRLHRLVPQPATSAQEPEPVEAVSVLVPARDESATIAGCVHMLRAQTGIPRLRIRVLDDASGDDTARIARSAADDDPRVEVLSGTDEPPAGWLGKPWACHRLAAGAPGSVYVFVDADVRLRPGALAAAVHNLRQRELDLLSAWPRQAARTPLARLVQPLQQWSWLTTLPLGLAETSPRPQLAAANGQFLVVDAAAYAACGGHASVRGEVLDDIELARSFKRSGSRTGLADASAVASCLMYRTDADVVAGYAKSLWRAFGGPGRAVATGALLAAVYTAAPLGVFSRDPAVRLLSGAAYASGVAGRVVSARATGARGWPDSAAHPLSAAAFAWLTAVSVLRQARGANTWRGRAVVADSPGPGGFDDG